LPFFVFGTRVSIQFSPLPVSYHSYPLFSPDSFSFLSLSL